MRVVPAGPHPEDVPGLGGPATLEAATDRYGDTPRRWLAGALQGTGEPVLDLRRAAVPGRLELRLPGAAPPVPAEPGRLPVGTNAAAGVRADMCLPAVAGLHDLFAELRRVLRPSGTLAALVPCRSPGPLEAPAAWWPLRRALRGHPGFVSRAAQDSLGWLLAAADFAVILEQRRTFRLPVPDGESAGRVVDGLVAAGVWAPDLGPARLSAARRALTRYAAPGRTLPVALRLLVARR
jgi:SAM-dependent methyltransferase